MSFYATPTYIVLAFLLAFEPAIGLWVQSCYYNSMMHNTAATDLMYCCFGLDSVIFYSCIPYASLSLVM